MNVYIVRKHPPNPFGSLRGHLSTFEVIGTFAARKDAEALAAKKTNPRGFYLYTIGKLTVKENKDAD